jgi:siroheme synthase-like protein
LLTISLDVKGAAVTVIGGGAVAARKAQALLGAGARVRVISPVFSPEFAELSITRVVRAFEPGDTEGAFLVVAATGDAAVDATVAAEAKAAGRLVNVASGAELGNFHFAAEVQRGPVTVAVATGGASPALARRLKAEVEKAIGPEWGALADLLSEARERLKTAEGLSQPERAAIYWQIVNGPALDLLAKGDTEGARAAMLYALAEKDE